CGTGPPIPQTGAGGRRQLVRSVGCQVYLRHLVRPRRSPCDRGGSFAALYSPRGYLARVEAESRWRVGRILSVLRRPCMEREGRQHAFSNGLGHHGTHVCRHERRLQCRSRRPIFAAPPNERWFVGRGPSYRHRIPSSILSTLPLVLSVLSLVGLGDVSESADAREDAG